MFTNQREAIKKIFLAYENYVVMSGEAGNNWSSYAKDVVNTIPELIRVYPDIALLETKDEFGILKKIVMEKYKKDETS